MASSRFVWVQRRLARSTLCQGHRNCSQVMHCCLFEAKRLYREFLYCVTSFNCRCDCSLNESYNKSQREILLNQLRRHKCTFAIHHIYYSVQYSTYGTFVNEWHLSVCKHCVYAIASAAWCIKQYNYYR